MALIKSKIMHVPNSLIRSFARSLAHTGRFWMDNIHCVGNETEIKYCRFEGWGKNDCDASEAAGVVCKGAEVASTETTKSQSKKVTKHLLSKKYDIELRLTGGRNKYEGQVEVSAIHYNRLTKRQHQHQHQHQHLSSTLQTKCRPTLTHCVRLVTRLNVDWPHCKYINSHFCVFLSFLLLPFSFSFSSSFSYLLHIFIIQIRFNKVMKKGHWGGICGDGWSLLEANIVCKSLNLGYASHAMQTDIFSNDTLSKILISGTECYGNESTIQDCMHHELGNVVCPGDQSKVAAVICTEKMADLVFDYNELIESAHLEDRPMFLLQCAMEENCLASKAYEIQRDRNDWHMETRRLLKFTARTLNAGTADFRSNIPKHLWEWHLCHQ